MRMGTSYGFSLTIDQIVIMNTMSHQSNIVIQALQAKVFHIFSFSERFSRRKLQKKKYICHLRRQTYRNRWIMNRKCIIVRGLKEYKRRMKMDISNWNATIGNVINRNPFVLCFVLCTSPHVIPISDVNSNEFIIISFTRNVFCYWQVCIRIENRILLKFQRICECKINDYRMWITCETINPLLCVRHHSWNSIDAIYIFFS